MIYTFFILYFGKQNKFTFLSQIFSCLKVFCPKLLKSSPKVLFSEICRPKVLSTRIFGFNVALLYSVKTFHIPIGNLSTYTSLQILEYRVIRPLRDAKFTVSEIRFTPPPPLRYVVQSSTGPPRRFEAPGQELDEAPCDRSEQKVFSN